MKTFSISTEIKIDIDLPIQAETLDDALKQAKDLKVTDFVKPKGDYIDSDFALKGAWQQDSNFEKVK